MSHAFVRRALAAALVVAPLSAVPSNSAATAATPRSSAVSGAILDVLEQSLKSGKGVLVYVGHHAVGGAVVKIGEQTVEMKSREYGRIVLRLDRIDGVAGN